jgi:hypothetical protein
VQRDDHKKSEREVERIVEIQVTTKKWCPCCGRKLIIKCSGAPDCSYDGE